MFYKKNKLKDLHFNLLCSKLNQWIYKINIASPYVKKLYFSLIACW